MERIQCKDTVSEFVDEYTTKLDNLMNKHCPITLKQTKFVQQSPWFDHEYKELRKKRRKLEKKYHQTQNENDKMAFMEARRQTTSS